MDTNIMQHAKSGDIKTLRYDFIDALDVDPTFEKYREDYEYCMKNIPGFFEENVELTTFENDKNKWTMEYWEQLKKDISRNFSEKRYEHMIVTAKTVFADKVKRLMSERNNSVSEVFQKIDHANVTVPAEQSPVEVSANYFSDEDNLRIERRRKEIEENNRKVEARQKAEQEELKRAQEKSVEANDNEPKKHGGSFWV